jgi:hypothetical protein
MIEILIPLLLVSAMIFGLLWLVVEGGTKLTEILANRK